MGQLKQETFSLINLALSPVDSDAKNSKSEQAAEVWGGKYEAKAQVCGEDADCLVEGEGEDVGALILGRWSIGARVCFSARCEKKKLD